MKRVLTFAAMAVVAVWLFSADGKRFRDSVLGATDRKTELVSN